MENLNEKGEVAEKGVSGIKEKRLKILKGNYQKAELIDFIFKDVAVGECSDMASMMRGSVLGGY